MIKLFSHQHIFTGRGNTWTGEFPQQLNYGCRCGESIIYTGLSRARATRILNYKSSDHEKKLMELKLFLKEGA